MTRHTRQLWIRLALDRHTRKIVSCFIGQRDAVSAFGLWDGLPAPYLDAATHTDHLGAYKSVVFGALHRIGGTQHIERFNATLRVRLAHLVRRTLSFSRKQANLEMLIWLWLRTDSGVADGPASADEKDRSSRSYLHRRRLPGATKELAEIRAFVQITASEKKTSNASILPNARQNSLTPFGQKQIALLTNALKCVLKLCR